MRSPLIYFIAFQGFFFDRNGADGLLFLSITTRISTTPFMKKVASYKNTTPPGGVAAKAAANRPHFSVRLCVRFFFPSPFGSYLAPKLRGIS